MELKLLEQNESDEKFIQIDDFKSTIYEINHSNLKSDEIVKLKLDFSTINLGEKLYGNDKLQSKLIQKKNCNLILKIESICERVIKYLLKNNFKFDGVIYVNNLKLKKNNNDFLIESLLNLKFNKYKDKMAQIIIFSCDYLAKENSLNNMCDFRDNKCVSCRDRNIDRVIGCCQKNCKFAHTGVCDVKNISCKLYMCSYIENKGYYFSPYYLPITKKYLNLCQRFFSTCLLFKPLEYQVKVLKFVKFLPFIFIAIILMVIILGII